jgi:hypothetical protein
MSEIAAPTAVAETAAPSIESAEPVTTESVIEDAIADLPGSEASQTDSESDSEPETTQDASGEEDPAPAADPLADELGLKPGSKNHRIPYARVQKIIAAQREKAAAEIKQQYAQFEAPAFKERMQALELAERDPETFVRALAQAPQFREIFASLAQPQAAEQPAAAGAQAPTAEPQPDLMLQDGTVTYSAQRLNEVMQYREAKMQKLLDERLAPVQQIEQERQLMQQWDGAVQRQRTVIEDARANWAGFKDAENQIRDLIAANPSLTLEGAYRQAVLPKLQADRDKMRQEILAEMNRRPAAASGTVPGAAPAASAGEQSTEDVIRDAIRGLKR